MSGKHEAQLARARKVWRVILRGEPSTNDIRQATGEKLTSAYKCVDGFAEHGDVKTYTRPVPGTKTRQRHAVAVRKVKFEQTGYCKYLLDLQAAEGLPELDFVSGWYFGERQYYADCADIVY